jgi:CO/xanthine dehydrogenase Mo-binding subunit
MSAAGRSLTRLDGPSKVTGRAIYAADRTMSEQCWAVAVRSSRAHALIRGIDRSAAEAAPGVRVVITSSDLSGLYPRFGHIIADHPILAVDRVRFFGEPVALVVAESRHAAEDAAGLVEVDYEDLPAVMDVEAALADGAPLLHTEAYDRGDPSFTDGIAPAITTNVVHEVELSWGDVESAMAGAAAVVETTMRYPMLFAYAMELYNATAIFDDDGLHVVTTAQHPFQVRDDLARIFSLPLARVRVEAPLLGGGYGSKSYTKVEPLAAIGAYVTGRPVKVALDVEGAVFTTRADSAVVRARSGFDAEGRIVARDFDIVLDSGAYADNSPLVISKAVNRCFGPYRIANLRVRGRSVYTNTTPASSYRGFGAPQGNLAGEVNLDQAAERLGIDAADLRGRNLLRPGESVLPGMRGLDADLAADLELLIDALDHTADRPDLRGVGFGCSASDAGAYPVSTAVVKVLADGSVVVLSGSTEMGQGSRTALAQVAATELGVAIDVVSVVQGDTAHAPYERTTGASRTTTVTGTAVLRACLDVREKMAAMAAEILGIAPDQVKQADGGVKVEVGEEMSFADIVEAWFGASGGEVTGIGIVRRTGEHEALPPFWEIGMTGVEVSVDPDTGAVEVEHLATVADVGFAINPRLVEGQDLGAATQGLGAALHEEVVYDGPQPVNPNVVEYRVPRTTDVPDRVTTILAERGDGLGPYGAKGAGEGALNPVGAAVTAAVARAIGRWPDRLPLTPERVWTLMQEEPSP